MGIFIPKAATPVQAHRIISEAVSVENRYCPSASRTFQYSQKSSIRRRVVAVPPQNYKPPSRIPPKTSTDDMPRFLHSSASTIDSDGPSDSDQPLGRTHKALFLPETTAGEIGWLMSGEKHMLRWRRPRLCNEINRYAESFLLQNKKGPFQRGACPS